MKQFNFIVNGVEKETLSLLIKDSAKRAKFEQKLKLEFFRYMQDKNPDYYDMRLQYNKTKNKYVIKLEKII